MEEPEYPLGSQPPEGNSARLCGQYSTQPCPRQSKHCSICHKSCADWNNFRGKRHGLRGESLFVLRRIPQDTQLEFFQKTLLYLSQNDAARALGVSVRVIQYWESQGLIHPELPAEGRNRRYTPRDLVELRFIHSLVVEQGFQVPALAAKLRHLEAPYDYDPLEVFWDPRDLCWKSRGQLAGEQLQRLRPQLDEQSAAALRQLTPLEPGAAARFLLDFVRDVLLNKPRKRRRTKKE